MEVVDDFFNVCCVVGLLILTVATYENIRQFNLRMVNGGSILSCRVSLVQKLQVDVNEGSDDLVI
jgi:hypothetical protein